jgi:hypothetical protein
MSVRIYIALQCFNYFTRMQHVFVGPRLGAVTVRRAHTVMSSRWHSLCSVRSKIFQNSVLACPCEAARELGRSSHKFVEQRRDSRPICWGQFAFSVLHYRMADTENTTVTARAIEHL